MWQKLFTSQLAPKTVNINRLKTISIVISLIFTLLSIRLFDVASFKQKKVTPPHHHASLIKQRPLITDRNGVILALDLDAVSLYANAQLIKEKSEVASKLVQVLPDLDYKQTLNAFNSEKTFIWLKRNLTPKEQFEVNKLGIPGLAFENTAKRIYTHGNLLSHIIGFVGIDGKGLAGIEKYYDNQHQATLPPEPITLAIDTRIQNIVYEELSRGMKNFNAIGGVGLVMDAKTGELLASVSLPSFDPYNPGNATHDEMFNRFSLGLYEPGSTFKTFTMAIALDAGVIGLNDVYDVDAPIKAARFKINDYQGKGGSLSVPEIFIYSSNIGVAKINMELGANTQRQFLKNFGLLDILDTEIPERSAPIYPRVAKWSDLSSMTISYGHGIAVTPLHMITAANAMINGGLLYKPTYLKKNQELPSLNAQRVIKKETSHLMQKLFRLAVEYGTGKKANVEGYLVGGKTGTADKNNKGNYKNHSRLSSFVSAFPINDPQYTLLIMLDEPKGNITTGGYATAGVTAAPVSGEIIARIGPLLGINLIDENNHIEEQFIIDYQEGLDHEL
jgi:cell division protein FtsI (penicillin-binding protein 3)